MIARRVAFACAIAAFTAGLFPATARSQQAAPMITPLPDGAVAIQSCNWNAKSTNFDADIKLANHTNLRVAKARMLLTFINQAGEEVDAYADMAGSSVSLVKDVPMTGKWTHGTFPMSLRKMRCALVGVKFQGYPNVIFSAEK